MKELASTYNTFSTFKNLMSNGKYILPDLSKADLYPLK